MFIVVSNNTKVPKDLDGFQVEQWSAEEFLDRASSDDGIEIDEGIWYDVSYLTEPIYEGLKAYKEAGVNLVYYRYSDKPNIDFYVSDDIKVYDVNEPKLDESPVSMVDEPEPVASQDLFNDPEPVMSQPMQTQQPMMQQPQQMYQPPQQNMNPYGMPMMQNNMNVMDPAMMQPQMNMQPQMGMQNNGSQIGGTAIAQGVNLVGGNSQPVNAPRMNMNTNMSNMLQYDDYDSTKPQANRKAAPAKVILFGSSKGGTGKTFTCLISAYWYAKTHPTQRIALADFDIIDGQIGITINKLTPTMQDFYKLHKGGHNDYEHLDNCKVKSDHFSPNIDFFLAPSQDIPTITNDNDFWTDLFKLLITNYDVVFFDSGIDYLGKPPISQLYKIADKIIITCNPSINSVKSVIKQFKTLSGQRVNNVFRPGDDILSRTNVVLTRVYENQTINDIVVQNIIKFAPVIAAFGNIDSIISQVQWYQQWELIDNNPDITASLDNITNID